MSRSSSTRVWWSPVVRALFGSFPRKMALGASLAAVTVAAGVGLLGLSGWFIVSTAIAGLQLTTALAFDVFMPSAGIRLLALGRTASRYGERLVTHDATLATLAALRARLFLGWARVSAGEMLRRPAQVLQRLTGDLDALESLFLRLLVPAAAAVGAALLCALVFAFMAPWFAGLFGLWLVVVGLSVPVALAWFARRAMVRRSLATELLRAHAVDLVSGQTDLVMAQRLAQQCQNLARADRRLTRADRRLNRLEVGAGAVHTVVSSLTLALALLGGAYLVQTGATGTAGAALIILMALGATEPFAALRRGGIEAGRTWLAARRLAQPLAEASDSADTTPSAVLKVGQHHLQQCALRIENVSARYPVGHTDVLQHISVDVLVGERVAVVGPSGSGKSTLIALVTGELAPLAGTVQSQPYAWLSQRSDLFQDSLRDNLKLASPLADDAALWEALDAAGLGADIRALDAGLDSRLGEGSLGLSGGQARRLALARMLLQPHALWLLDEPTEGLDAPTAAYVLNKLDEAGAGRTWFLATHLRREARLADRLLVLRAGQITEDWRRGSAGFESVLAKLRPD